jgi:hypothetical protein
VQLTVRRELATALLLLLAFPIACHHGDPVAERIESIRSAVEKRDADAVAKSLSDTFRGDSDETRQQVVSELRQYLFAYRDIDVRIRDLQISTGSQARSADFIAETTGNPKTIGGLDQILPRSSRIRFHVELENDGGTWRVTSASWQRLE